MKKKFQFSSILLLIAAVLLFGSAVGSTQAALTYYSENYSAEVTVSNIGITLVENGEDISRRNYLKDDKWDEVNGTLFGNMLEEGEKFILGKTYDEELIVKNSGAIDTYVRVIINKSWKTASGFKYPHLSTDLIDLKLRTGDNGWIVDTEASTDERTVLYYSRPLAADGGKTPSFAESLRVDPALATKIVKTVNEDNGLETIRYEYEYDGYSFNVDVEVDAVQTHNAVAAIRSAWGVKVNVTDGVLSLNPSSGQ